MYINISRARINGPVHLLCKPRLGVIPAPLSDRYFQWLSKPVISIVSRDRGIAWIVYALFHEVITNGVWTATGLVVLPTACAIRGLFSRINGPNEDSGGGMRGRESEYPAFLISASCIQT